MIRVLLYPVGILAALLLADLLTRRIARRGECVLHRAVVLPDSCQGDCPPGQRCRTVAWRRSWLWGRQAAACACEPTGERVLTPNADEGAPSPAPERENV